MLAEWQVGQVLFSLFWFYLFFIWIWLLVKVFADIFRSKDLGGVAKVLWLMVVMFFPFLGVFIYLIARGSHMAQHDLEAYERSESAAREYIRSAAGTAPSAADELERLAGLRSQGVIDDAEFARLKAKVTG